MERTDERRPRHPQGQSRGRAPEYSRQSSGRPRRQQSQQRPAQRRREDPPVRERRPGGYEQPRARQYEQPRNRAYQEEPRRRSYSEEPRRRSASQAPRTRRYEDYDRGYPQRDPRQRTYDTQRRRPEEMAARRRADAEYRRRREQERLRQQQQRQSRMVTSLLVVVAAILAVFCLYDPDDTSRPWRPDIQAHAGNTVTEPPTEPPTEAPTRPPIRVTPISSLEDLATLQVPDFVDVQIIDVDYHSRRGSKLHAINNIVLHYVGNPGTTGQQNRDWYADVNSNVSSHFVVGLQGEIIQCIPLDEASSASNDRNFDTISVEVCHPDESGKFNDATYDAVVDLLAWLLKACDLELEHLIRHYEVTGKICPKYYVENDDAWQKLRADVAARMAQ